MPNGPNAGTRSTVCAGMSNENEPSDEMANWLIDNDAPNQEAVALMTVNDVSVEFLSTFYFFIRQPPPISERKFKLISVKLR